MWAFYAAYMYALFLVRIRPPLLRALSASNHSTHRACFRASL